LFILLWSGSADTDCCGRAVGFVDVQVDREDVGALAEGDALRLTVAEVARADDLAIQTPAKVKSISRGQTWAASNGESA